MLLLALLVQEFYWLILFKEIKLPNKLTDNFCNITSTVMVLDSFLKTNCLKTLTVYIFKKLCIQWKGLEIGKKSKGGREEKIDFKKILFFWQFQNSIWLLQIYNTILHFSDNMYTKFIVYSQWTKHNRCIYHFVSFDPTHWCSTECCKQQLVIEITAGCYVIKLAKIQLSPKRMRPADS